jgi:hypothetical protein
MQSAVRWLAYRRFVCKVYWDVMFIGRAGDERKWTTAIQTDSIKQ